jgi:hypothetical protein
MPDALPPSTDHRGTTPDTGSGSARVRPAIAIAALLASGHAALETGGQIDIADFVEGNDDLLL